MATRTKKIICKVKFVTITLIQRVITGFFFEKDQRKDSFVNEAPKRGCIIYVQNCLVSSSHPISSSDYEETVGCYIHLQIGDKLSVVCVYRSPNSSNMNNDKLLNLIDQVIEGNSSHILLLGDFNYRNIDWQQGTQNQERIEKHLNF